MVAESILHKVNLCIWVARIFIKYLFMAVPWAIWLFWWKYQIFQRYPQGKSLLPWGWIEKSLAFNICTHVQHVQKTLPIQVFKEKQQWNNISNIMKFCWLKFSLSSNGICRYCLKCKYVTVGTGGPLLWSVEGVPYNT